MGRVVIMNKPIVALLGLPPGFGAIRESHERDEALSRWEDDGGRVIVGPWTHASGSLREMRSNRAWNATHAGNY